MLCEEPCSTVFTIAFPIIGNITSIILFLSPVLHSNRIFHTNSLNDYNPFPNMFGTLNCISWVFYGIVTRNWYLLAVNIFGCCLCLFNVLMTIGPYYHSTAPMKDRGMRNLYLSILWFITNLFVQLLLFAVAVLNLEQKPKELLLGYSCIFYLLVFYASPLQVLSRVVTERNSRHFFLPFSLTCFVNGICWSFYGFAISDYFVALPNAFGAVMAIIQIGLIFRFPKRLDYGMDINLDQESMGSNK
eukprot:NODE_473_length_7005_cov_0.742977.p4 type:complete len:245 gc:universal NODE_473_length_7005_cov_0.742977:2649-1915(-)